MSDDRSAWKRYPGYRIDITPCSSRGRVRFADTVVAESDACLLVKESDHDARIYFPKNDVQWHLFAASDHTTFCGFKGDASYWSISTAERRAENLVWAYHEPFEEVAALAGYVSFDTEQAAVELAQQWRGSEHEIVARFPIWGDVDDLARLLDVQPAGDSQFVSPPYPDPPLGTFFPQLKEKRGRSVVEGGHQLAQAVVAAAKSIPEQRVTSASMIFSKAASYDAPLDLKVNILRKGRNFSTVDIRILQQEQLRSAGLILMDSSPGDRIRQVMAMPDVPGPLESEPYDMKVSGRDLRIVHGAYTNDLDHIGPPELYAWIRFRDAPAEAHMHAALMTQATTHWTIAAALRPHPGISEAMAHVTLSTGPMKTDISFHDDVDVTEWMLYVNDAVYAGRGQAQGQGQVFAIDGRLLATYSVHAMVRDFAVDPSALNKGHDTLM